MLILPTPKKIIEKEGHFNITPKTEIVLDKDCNFRDLEVARSIQNEIEENLCFTLSINKSLNKTMNCIYLKKINGEKEAYSINITKANIEISGVNDVGLFYGVQTLRQIIKTNGVEIPCLEIDDLPYFKNRGFYHDITRGKIPTLDTLKELADRAAFYKINQLQLYVEHTFAFKKHSEVWTGADPLSAEEILLFDQYCKERHIELVPSLSTFGHLYHALSAETFNELCELEDTTDKPFAWIDRMAHHTLDTTNLKSIEFVRDMLKEFVPLFSSEKFNICADETFDLGKGKSKEAAKKVGSGRLYIEFLNKIIKSVKGYDKQVMFWGDVILAHPELIKDIPDDVICLNWDYAAIPNEDKIRAIAKSGMNQYVCPGVAGWNRMMNDLDSAFSNIQKLIQYGKKYKAIGILNTDWGDYGHINLFANSMPGMIYGAALSWNPDEVGNISLTDEKISRIEYSDLSGKLIGLLRELSKQEVFTWWNLISWKEHYLEECCKNEYLLGELSKIFSKYSEIEIRAKYNRVLEIENEILKLTPMMKQSKKIDLEEFYVSAQGIAIFNSLYLIFKRYEAKKNVGELIYEPKELAERLEYWFVDFSNVWRKRNKESELFRIKDTLIKVCSYLRKI